MEKIQRLGTTGGVNPQKGEGRFETRSKRCQENSCNRRPPDPEWLPTQIRLGSHLVNIPFKPPSKLPPFSFRGVVWVSEVDQSGHDDSANPAPSSRSTTQNENLVESCYSPSRLSCCA